MNFSTRKYFKIRFLNPHSDIMKICLDKKARDYKEISLLPRESFDYIIRNRLAYSSDKLEFLEELSFQNILDANNFLHEIEDQISLSFQTIRLNDMAKDSFKELYSNVHNLPYLEIKNIALGKENSPHSLFFENFIINGAKIHILSLEEYRSMNYFVPYTVSKVIGAAAITVDFPEEIKFSSYKKEIIELDKEQGIYQQKITTSEISKTGEEFFSFIQNKSHTYNSNRPIPNFRGKKCIGLFEIIEREGDLLSGGDEDCRNFSELDIELLSLSEHDKDKVLKILKLID
jgi:hypothetical protein